MQLYVVMPSLNESLVIGQVLKNLMVELKYLIQRGDIRQFRIIVVDNGSTDETAVIARAAGALVTQESKRGYGKACLAGLKAVESLEADSSTENPVILFLNADGAECLNELRDLLFVYRQSGGLVVGSRTLGVSEEHAMYRHQSFGNELAVHIIGFFFKRQFTDLGPLRLIGLKDLRGLNMKDPDYGWIIEMQIKAILANIEISEVPVSTRKTLGKSKISGTFRGTVGAGYKIMGMIFYYGLGYRVVRGRRSVSGVCQKVFRFVKYIPKAFRIDQ